MWLLPNVIYQFAATPRCRRPADPEADVVQDTQAGEAEPDASHDVDGGGGGPPSADPEEDLLDGNDNEDADDNEIIQQLEREEYPDQQPKRRQLSHFNTWSSFSTIKSAFPTSLSLFWTKIKLALDPRTSPTELEWYAPHYRYMPIISGIVIPLSILLEIPGLTEDWYIRTEANKTVERRPNTPILETGLAVSMAFGVLANICLICRFMEKRVKYMTILCVIFLTIHDLINITAVTIFGVEHRFDDGFTYGQGFWMIVCSTSASTFTNITLVIDLVRTPQFATSGSGLTRKQRSLVISVIVLISYIALGSLVNTFVMDLTFLNALYFTVVTLETIGFGDIHPKTAGARIFICVYTVGGIITLALTVGLARETVLENIEFGYRKRVRAVQRRRKAFHRERRILRRWRAAIEFHLHQIDQPVWVKDLIHQHSFYGRWFDKIWPWPKGGGTFFRYNRTLGYGDHSHPHGMHLNLEALSWPQLEAAAMEAGAPLRTFLPPGFKTNTPSPHPLTFSTMFSSEVHTGLSRHGSNESKSRTMAVDNADIPLTHSRLGRMIVMLGSFGLAVNHSQFSKVPKQTRPPPIQVDTSNHTRPRSSVSVQFDTLRTAMEQEEKRAFYARLCVVWVIFIVFWTVGSGIFTLTEKWPYGNSLYFCFVSFTTIGYGDFTPQTPAGRSIFVVWALLGVATMTILISILSEAYSSRYKRAFHSNIFSRVLNRYRERTQETAAERKRPPDTQTLLSANSPPNANDTLEEQVNSPATIDEALEDSRRRAEGHLATLPQELRRQARSFNESVQYLMNEPGAVGLMETDMPDGLKQMMNDVAGVEKLGERIKREILKDPSARNTLLAISIERTLRNMICIAEEAIDAIKERDRLAELRSATEDVGTAPETARV